MLKRLPRQYFTFKTPNTSVTILRMSSARLRLWGTALAGSILLACAQAEEAPRSWSDLDRQVDELTLAQKWTRAESLAREALALATASGRPAAEKAISTARLGILHEFMLRPSAETELREALAMGGLPPQARGDVYQALGRRLERSRQFAESESMSRQALAVFTAMSPLPYPDIASVYMQLARLYETTGRPQDARAQLEAAMRVLEQWPGKPDTPGQNAGFWRTTAMLAVTLIRQDRAAQARELYDTALRRQQEAAGVESVEVAAASCARAGVHVALKEFEQARDVLQQCRKLLGPESAAYFEATSMTGVLAFAMGRLDEADEALQEATASPEITTTSPSTGAQIIRTLGGVRMRQNRLADAARLFERAVAHYESAGGEPDALWATMLEDVVRVRERLGDHAGAKEAYLRSVEVWKLVRAAEASNARPAP